MNLQRFTYLFFLISIIEIAADSFEIKWLAYLTKPMIMLSIMVYFYLQTKNEFTWHHKTMLLAFMFSLLGDIFLMIPQKNLFVFGLGSFLMTHLCLIFIFGLKYKVNSFARVSFLIFAIGFITFLRKHLPEALFLPVLIYGFTISTMGIRAAERQSRLKNHRMVFLGAVLFIISDSCIAINKFVTPLPLSTLIIMGTYVLAQYLICVGYLEKE